MANKISFNLALLFVSLLCMKVIIFPSKAANVTVLKLISKPACSLKYYRDQIPICLSIRRYHRRENTYISENPHQNILIKTSPPFSLHFKRSLMRKCEKVKEYREI